MHDALGEALATRRVRAVLPHISGRLLDVGCGSNRLVRHYANGVGVDVHPWPGADVIVADTATLQWESASFDTVTIIAALNHIPNRAAVLNECRRVLRPGGRVVITMLTPRTSRIWHWLRAPWDADQRERGMRPGEVLGEGDDLVVRQNHAEYSISAISQKNEQDGNASFRRTGPTGMSRNEYRSSVFRFLNKNEPSPISSCTVASSSN